MKKPGKKDKSKFLITDTKYLYRGKIYDACYLCLMFALILVRFFQLDYTYCYVDVSRDVSCFAN